MRRRLPFLVSARAIAAASALAVGALPSIAGANAPRLAFVQVPSASTRPVGGDIRNTILSGRYLEGMRIAIGEIANVADGPARVIEGFVCATDPVFSHDGKRLAFSGRRTAGDYLQIWELAGDDAVPRQIVTCEADCISPVYMPSGHIVFASLLSGEYEEHGGPYSFSLYELAPGSEAPTRLTFNPSSDFDPVIMPDGRLLYSSWQHVGNHFWPRGNIALMLINSDGTGVFPLTGNHRGPWAKHGAAPLDWDRVAWIAGENLTGFGEGTLMMTRLNDAFAPYETLLSPDAYRVTSVAPWMDKGIVISARPTDGSSPTFGLHVWQDGAVKLLYDHPDYHELFPAVGATGKRPLLRISTVVPDTPHGYLLVLNCYETDRTDQHPLRQGAVKTVRVIEGLPTRRAGRRGPEFFSVPGRESEPMIRPDSATGVIPSRILGEVPPAPDGSVYLKVPSDRPLRLQLVDHEGFALMNERAWFWVRPNERRACLGCHENRELSPHNVTPLAAGRKPTDLTDPAGWQTISFRQDIQPIIQANCAKSDCHVPPTPTAGMNLTATLLNGDKDAVLADRFGPAYANLLERQEKKPFAVGGRRVHPGDSRRSPLLWMLYGRPLAPQFKPAPFERPMVAAHPGPMLSEDHLALFRKWIDLGAPYDVTSPPGPWPYEIPPATGKTEERDDNE